MRMIQRNFVKNLGKIALAVLLIGCIIAFAAKDIAPHTSTWRALLVFAGIGLVFICALLLAVVLQAQTNQYVLKKGGTDAQWLWFSGDKNPPGLQKLLDERDAEAEGQSHSSINDRHSS
jgi:hypothetical protein